MTEKIRSSTTIGSTTTERLDAYQQMRDPLRERCSGRAAIDVVRGRWKASILYFLRSEPQRFGELQRRLHGIADHTLTTQLRQLEADGVIRRIKQRDRPASVAYSLTHSGESLSRIMQQLETWGTEYLAQR